MDDLVHARYVSLQEFCLHDGSYLDNTVPKKITEHIDFLVYSNESTSRLT